MSGITQTRHLIDLQTRLNDTINKLTKISVQCDANTKKLSKMTSYEEKWEQAFEDAQDVDKKCTTKDGHVWKDKGTVLNAKAADKYAHAKVQQYDQEVLLDLEEKDMEYDATKTLLEAEQTKTEAEIETTKQSAQKGLQDTHVYQS